MAKNKVEIDVKVDDKGSTKKVELGANKAAEGLEKVANRSRTADRNIKGVAATSSSATKNFSKMSQGVGGLVGAYATFAATMFAVSAVFQFFKSAADLQELQTGQELYARHTGLAIRSLSLDIVEATNNQIGFKDASQAAAIGLSSGLNVEQLKKLGEAAKGASAVLGRDVPDSFNRLIRGATKAEPELLDELGIILRLEDAKKRYALETGKQAQSLTAFEEKQAVTNEIIRQAEEKYLSATAGATGLGNSVQKLATVLQNDLLNPFMNVVAALATPIFDILADNIYALAAAMAGLAAPLIRTITGVAGAAGDAAKEAHKEAVKQADNAKAAHAEYATEVESQEKRLQNTYQKSRDVAAGQVAGLNSRKGSHVEILKSGKDLNDKQIAAMKLNVIKKNGIYSAMNDMQRGDLVKTLGEMQLANKGATMSIQAQWSLTGMKLKLTFKSIAAAWKGLMSGMVLAAGFAATAINILLGAVSWIGLIVTGITLVAAAVGGVVDYFKSDATKEAEANQEKINQKIEDTINSVRSVREELDKAYDGVKPIADQFKAAAKAGNSLASIDLAGLTLLEGQGAAGNKDAQKEAEAMVNTIKTILKASGTAFGDIEKDINRLTVRTAQTLIPQLLAKNKLIQEAAQSLEKADEAFTSAMQQDSQSGKYTTEITALIQARDNLEKMKETVSLDADQAKALKRVEKNLQFLKSIRDIDSDIANKRRLSNLEFEESIVNVSKSTRQILGFNKKQADIGLTIEQTRREIANLETKQKENAGIFSDLEERNLKQKKQKLEDLDRELATSKKIQVVQMEEAKHAAIMEGLKRTDKLVNLKKIDVYATKSRKDEIAHQDKVAKNQTKRVDLERTKNIAEERHNTAVANFNKANSDANRNIMDMANLALINARLELEINTEQLRILDDEYERKVKIRDLDESRKKQELLLNMSINKSMHGLSSRQADRIQKAGVIIGLEQKLKELNAKEKAGLVTNTDLHAVQVAQAKQKLALEKDKLTQAYQYQLLIREGLETGIQENLKALITGEERSLKKALASMAKTVLDGFADKLAGDLTDDIMSLFGFDSPIKTAHVQGGVSVANSITTAFATAIAQLQTSMATMAAATGTASSIKDIADASSVTQAINNAGDGQGINVTAPGSVSMDTAETTVGGRVINEVIVTAQTLNETILTKLVPSLVDIGDPDVGLGAKVKAGFADFLLFFPRLFDSGIQLLLNGLRMIGVGSGGSSEFDYLESGMKLAMTAFGMANGGIAKGGFKAYADGGIASRPTLGLIGEGRYNEAVVPLPDGKSIPISGNVGQNIGEINITIDSNGASTTTGSGGAGGDGKSAVNLGKAIAKAVQDELHKQKRSGGILSPYGVA